LSLLTLNTGRQETRGQGHFCRGGWHGWGIRPSITGRKRFEALISDRRTQVARPAWPRDHRTSP
jgi:hypothetical protein